MTRTAGVHASCDAAGCEQSQKIAPRNSRCHEQAAYYKVIVDPPPMWHHRRSGRLVRR